MQLSLSELSRRVPFVVWRNLDGHDEFSLEAQGSALTRSRRAHRTRATGANTSLKWRRPSGLLNAGLKSRATFVKTALADRTWAASIGGRETTDQFECRAHLEVVRL